MATKKKKQRNSRTLVLYNGPPTQVEIDKIIREHRSIVLASRAIVPRAFILGEWLLASKKRIPKGDWTDWFKASLGKAMSIQTAKNYVNLAEHRQFLEQKFDLVQGQRAIPAEADFERFTSIRHCLQAISDLKKRPTKKDIIMGSIRKAIEVETTVSESTSTNGEGERATRIGLDIESTISQQNQPEPKDKVEDPDLSRTPIEEINTELSKSASCLRAASEFWQRALVIARYHAISSETVQAKLAEHLDDQPELALCFTSGDLLKMNTNSAY